MPLSNCYSDSAVPANVHYFQLLYHLLIDISKLINYFLVLVKYDNNFSTTSANPDAFTSEAILKLIY